jgi:hypothetical protein
MVLYTRSVRIARGKDLPSIKWAKEFTDWFNKKYNLQMKLYSDLFGEMGTLRWFLPFESLAVAEKTRNQLMADQEYWQKLSQAIDLFIEGRTLDTIMNEI